MATSTNYGWAEPDNTSLVKDGAQAMRTLGNAIDTSLWNSGMGQAGKNKFINGAFQVWQRGTSIAGASAKTYTADRWVQYRAGITVSRQVTGDTTNLPFIQYCARVQRDSGTSGVNANLLMNSMASNDAIPLAGKSVTFSFYARKGANYSATSSALVATLYSGTGTDQALIDGYTGVATVGTTTATLTTTWQRFSFTGTVAATATEVSCEFSFTPTGTAGANDYYEVTGAQLEVGLTATPFQTASGGSIQNELAMCQRYYQKSFAQTVTPANGANATSLTSNVGANYIYTSGATGNESATIYLKTTMRTTPTVTLYGNSTGNWLTPTTNAPMTLRFEGDNAFSLYQALVGAYTNTYGHWIASAEL